MAGFRAGAGKLKMNLKHIEVSVINKLLKKKKWGHVIGMQGTGSPKDKRWNNLSNKINNKVLYNPWYKINIWVYTDINK